MIQSLYYAKDREDNTNTFIQAMRNISGYLTDTDSIRKRKKGDIKHNLTETTGKYKV